MEDLVMFSGLPGAGFNSRSGNVKPSDMVGNLDVIQSQRFSAASLQQGKLQVDPKPT